MNNFVTLMHHKPLVFVHLVAALAALLLGIAILTRRKGTFSHRTLGWTWVTLMAVAATSSVFIRDYRIVNKPAWAEEVIVKRSARATYDVDMDGLRKAGVK